jgi:hypothetical protein
MPRLGDHDCYQVIKPVDLGPVLSIMDRLQFIGVNQGGTDTNRYPCSVVLQDKFPPELKRLVESLELGGRLGRAILRRLNPRQNIPPHIDAWMPAEIDWRRFQVPLVTHPDIIMRWPDDGVSVHLEPGFLYEVRYDRTHEVVHGADIARIHLQIDQVDATV